MPKKQIGAIDRYLGRKKCAGSLVRASQKAEIIGGPICWLECAVDVWAILAKPGSGPRKSNAPSSHLCS